MKKVLPLVLVLVGAALLITAVVFWVDSGSATAPPSFDQSLRDWLTLIAGLGASIKGWMDLAKKESPSPPSQSNTSGGIIISGTVDSIGKDVIGRDQHITTNVLSPDTAYNVEGLPNPYLGLQAFTYNERDRYAGREKLTEEALQLLVSSEDQHNLLFVTGASGSGKSSFVQASLLPALINYYERAGKRVKFEVFRPSRNPKTRLNKALKQLGSRNVQVIVIDQFEELFTQSVLKEREALFDFLKKSGPFEKSHRFIIATLRSDYLGEMFDVQWLWEIAKQGIELREMRIQELKDAIVRPLQAKFPSGDKRIDSKLVERLAEDTAENITYLPLLQVTLEEIWNKGQLKLGVYDSLTDAFKERADTVLTYHDFDRASPSVKRTDVERDEILSLLLDLVNPSLDNDVKHDARISRKLTDFNKQQISLFRELSKARLVSIEVEEGLEVVNLIHETLIRSWDVLSNGIKGKRLLLQKRARFEEQLRAWIAQDKADDYLMSKGQLTEATELERTNDIALRNVSAHEYLEKSIAEIRRQEQALLVLEQRIQEMNALTRVSQGMNITLTFDDVLELTFAQTTQIIPTSHFRIMLYNKAADTFYYGFRVDNRDRITALENQPLPTNLGLGQEVIRKGRPFITQDYTMECQVRNNIPSAAGIHAWMGVPLNAGAETIGALSVGTSDATVTYTRAQMDLLHAIANQLVGAIVKARLLQETQLRAQQLATLNEITRQLTSTLEQGPLLQNILDYAVSILNCEAGSLFLVDDESGDLVFRVTVGPVAGNLLGQHLPAGTGFVGRAVQSRAPVIENDLQHSTSHAQATDEKTGFTSRSLLAVPMMIKERVLGVIEVINRRDGLPFVVDDENILTAFTRQAAVAMENARLMALTDQELEARVEELQVMSRINRELNASLEIDRAMRVTLEWAMRRSNAEAGLIGIIEGDNLRVMAQQGYDDVLWQDENLHIPLELPGVHAAIESGQPDQISLASQGVKGLLPQAHTQIVVPIRREAEVIGLILLESINDSQVNLSFLNQLSESAAVAIANARLYEEVQRANLARSDFVSFVAHELKNPMTSIKGYIELLASGSVGQVNDMQANFLNTIRANVERLSALVSDLNDTAKIDANRLRLDFKTVNIPDVLDEVVNSAKRRVEGKRQTLELHLPPQLPLAWADRIRVGQILTNLISNAHKYSPEGGKIVIGAEVVANQWDPKGARQVVHFWVKDNGIGISPEDQAKIFQKYFRSDDLQARESPGTGLGLNITKSLVEMMGGRIWFESEYRQGTTFHFTIPVAEG